MNISYNNFDMLEVGYGINLRPLASFAEKVYGDDPCEFFRPHILDTNKFDPVDEDLAARMHKAIAICQFKVEGQRIKAHPEYKMEKRLLLDKIDFETGTVEIEGKAWPLRDTNFPTLNPENPYELTAEEKGNAQGFGSIFPQFRETSKTYKIPLQPRGIVHKDKRKPSVSRMHPDG